MVLDENTAFFPYHLTASVRSASLNGRFEHSFAYCADHRDSSDDFEVWTSDTTWCYPSSFDNITSMYKWSTQCASIYANLDALDTILSTHHDPCLLPVAGGFSPFRLRAGHQSFYQGR